MRPHTVPFLAALVLPLAQATIYHPLPRELQQRQGGDAFVPGSTIEASCASDQLECGSDWCYTPSLGEVCCTEGYPCPDGSFCLTQGYCCPDGDDPKSCAAANGVTLSAGFNTAPVPATSAAPTGSSVSSAPLPAITTSSSSPTTPEASSSPLATSVPATPYPVPSSSTATPLLTGTGGGTGIGSGFVTPTSATVSQYTGAAAGHAEVGGGLAMILGLLGYLL